MPAMISFLIEGTPVPKERPRVGQSGTITPKNTKEWEKAVGWTARAYMLEHQADLVEHPIGVELRIQVGNSQGDIDNFTKSVLDGLNGTLYVDDYQVEAINARIKRGCKTALHGVMVNIYTMDQWPWDFPF